MRQAKSCRPCGPSPANAAAFPAAPRAFQIQARPTPERQRGGAAGQLDRYLAMRQAVAPPVVQRMKDEEEASGAAKAFIELTGEEEAILGKINGLLAAFSQKPSKELFSKTEELILAAQEDIGKISRTQAAIIADYEKANAEIRGAFIQSYSKDLPKNFGKGQYEPEGLDDKPTYDAEWLQSMFDTLVERTVSPPPPEKEEDDSEEESEKDAQNRKLYRFRYLAYALQSMRDPIGTNQIRHLLALLGKDRRIVVAEGVKTDMSAGPVNSNIDNAKATKVDDGQPEDDADLFAEAQGNLYVFMQLKYGKGIDRTANPKANEIGDVQVNLDKDTYLFPIFAGIADERAFLFTTPKFMSVHHENGHLITMLQGKAGLGNQHKYKGALATLTSQEEAFNIFGSTRSDRAYAKLQQLPVRFDHKTLITYIQGSSTWEGWAKLLAGSEKMTTGAIPILQNDAARELGVLVAANWGGKTKYKSKPKGVTAIAKEMSKAESAEAKLTVASQSAVESRGRASSNRTKPTQDLYDLLAALNVKDYRSLTAFREGIATITQAL